MNNMFRKVLLIFVISILAYNVNTKVIETADLKKLNSEIPKNNKFDISNLSFDELEKAIKVNVVADNLKKYASKKQDFGVNPKFDIGEGIKHSKIKTVTGNIKPSANDLEKEIRVKVFNKKQNRTNNRLLHKYNIDPINIFGNNIQKSVHEKSTLKHNGTFLPNPFDLIITGKH